MINFTYLSKIWFSNLRKYQRIKSIYFRINWMIFCGRILGYTKYCPKMGGQKMLFDSKLVFKTSQ